METTKRTLSCPDNFDLDDGSSTCCDAQKKAKIDSQNLQEAQRAVDGIAFQDESTTWTLLDSPSGAVSEDRATFAKVSDIDWMCATRGSNGWSKGIHSWSVRLDKLPKGISVGICQKDIDFNDARENIHKRYDMFAGNGGAVDIENENHPCLHGPLRVGAIVSIRLDMDQRTLTFGLNGSTNVQPTFCNIAATEWYPYFALRTKDSTFTVIQTMQ